MKTRYKLLSLAALLTASQATLMQSVAQEGRTSVGDLQGYYDDEDYYGESEDAVSSPAVDESQMAQPQDAIDEPADSSFLAQASHAMGLQPVAYVGDTYYDGGSVSMGSDCGCGSTSCGGGSACGSSCGAAPSRRMAASMASQTQCWLTAEALLWFPQARSAPALVTQAPAGFEPDFAEDTTFSLFGGRDSVFATEDAIDGGMSPGFRIDGGRYLTDEIGIGGRFWWLSDNDEDFAASGNSTGPSIGRPFFDTTAESESAILVNYDDGVNTFAGDVAVETSLSMYGAEAYTRLKMLSGKGFRSELIGGYSHFGVDDELSMRSRTVQIAGTTQGTSIYQDALTAENRFHGGQIGMENTLNRGGWMIRSLTKVHLGNMNQMITGVGSETFIPTAGPTLTDLTGGALAISNFRNEQDEFTFIPELNLKLGYQFRKNIALTVGYSFLCYNDIATVGENINNVYNRSAVTFPAGDPISQAEMSRPQTRTLWVQGVDLGAVIEF